jgi:beta-lactamase regulating signal transducer with metallopeptidase domain
MNTVIDSLTPAWLADVAMQSTLVLGLALLLSLRRFGWAAARRHTVLCIAILLVPVLMLGSLWAPQWSWHDAPAAPVEASGWRTSVTVVADRGVAAAASAIPPAQPKPEPHHAASPISWVVLVWLSGVAIGWLLLIASALRLRRLRAASGVCHDQRVLALLGGSGASVLISTTPVMPMTWGWRKPVILLPHEALAWSDARLRLVLGHELAHIARGDALSHLCASICAVMLWFHPLMWLAMHRLQQAREEACDDQALATQPQSPIAYAEELLQTITALWSTPRIRSSSPALAIGMASQAANKLRQRLAAIMDDSADRQPFGPRTRRCVIVLGALTTVALSGLTACREQRTALPSAGSAVVDGSRVYFLTEEQFHRLSNGTPPAPPPPSDPFAPAPSPSAPRPPAALVDVAVQIRTKLVEQGIVFAPNDKGEALVMTDARCMKVWADESNHEQVARTLSAGTQEPMLQVSTTVFDVPMDQVGELIGEQSVDGFQMRGVLSHAAGEALVKKLGSTKGVVLCAAPTLTTRSGQRANIDFVREFCYPTEFDPPQIRLPGDAKVPEGSPWPVTPTTPTAFEMRPVGIRMEVDANIVGPNSIRLEAAPEVTNFDGFINFGSPIIDPKTGTVLSENRIFQPIFETSKLTFNVTLLDGQYVIVGGGGSSSGAQGAIGKLDASLEPKTLPDWRKSKTAIFFLITASVVKSEPTK